MYLRGEIVVIVILYLFLVFTDHSFIVRFKKFSVILNLSLVIISDNKVHFLTVNQP